MLKRIVLIVVFLILIFGLIIWQMPTTATINLQTIVNCNEAAANRMLFSSANTKKWWPGQKSTSGFYYNGWNYTISKITYASVNFKTALPADSLPGTLQINKELDKPLLLSWVSYFKYSANPFIKLRQYWAIQSFKKNLSPLLTDIKNFLESETNMYGMAIAQEKVKDSSYISLKQTFTTYPATADIYKMIGQLEKYIRENNGEQTGAPMLNVHQSGNSEFEAMVAVPTKSDLPEKNEFKLKKMVLGNILKAEVTGGLQKILQGEKELANYVSDHKKVSPAIPFQSLVTNRLEADSSKWVTNLYYPIF